ncbi:restriction system protein [Paenibacillus algorifonticola]|uniref:Restriction system protein n=1 Tax=Paenibacillus algorifonticola TaxID=684063 RepID=A0A1I2BTX4_9BACL|nr:restriction endonuclease [Paenibacillus algorifonticola]SFE59495.1 restriction system protein [Paenibacillus algorifonticola]
MAKRKRKKEELDPIKALVLLLMLGAGFGSYKLTSSFILAGVAFGAVMMIYAIVVISITRKRNERLKRSGIADIDKMEGRQFEKYLGHLLEAHGYSVTVTQAAGDFGADLVLAKGTQRVVVQAKRYSKNVGIKAVQEAQASIAHYSASEAWVISNSGYTEAAVTLAKSNAVRLIDRAELIEMILKVNANSSIPTAGAETEQHNTEKMITKQIRKEVACAKCGQPLVRRKSARGEFLGCSSYPKCRHTEAV